MNSGITKRAFVFIVLFVLGFGMLVLRLFALQIINYDKYQQKVLDQLTTESKINAERGSIYDTNMVLLATNVTVWRVFISPVDIRSTNNKKAMSNVFYRMRYGMSAEAAAGGRAQDEIIASGLSEILGLDYNTIIEKAAKKGRLDETIAREIDKETADRVRAFIIENNLGRQVHLEPSSKRYYCYDNLASHVLGFTGTDGGGLYGLELQYNKELTGTSGRYITARNARGGDMPFKYESYIKAENGYNLVTTIDMRIQYELESQLEATLIESGSRNRVCGIVMDVHTGAILAMATKPDYNLNDPFSLGEYYERELAAAGLAEDSEEFAALRRELRLLMWNNKPINELYEPGSTFKIVTSAMALEDKKVNINDRFVCTGSHVVANNIKPINCHKVIGHGSVNFAEGLQQSCNPVLMTIASRVGNEAFYNYFKAFGYAEKTSVDLPGEAMSLFSSFANFRTVELAVYSFGQTFKVTPIQQLTAICAVANGGYLVTPHLLKEFSDDNGSIIKSYDTKIKRQIVSAETCASLTQILEEGVSGNGGAKNAYVPGYRVAAKTGTSQKRDKMDEFGNDTLRVGSCVAYAPADNPQIAVIIMVDEPQGSVYGSIVAAPYISKLLGVVLPYLGIEAQYTEAELAKMEVNLPSYNEWLAADAKKNIESLGLKCEIVGEGSLVLAQIPEAGSMMAKNPGRVILYTGTHTPENSVTVPDVMRRQAATANQMLINAGLNIKVTGAKNYQVGAAEVVYQSPAAGESVAPGTVVTVEFRHMDGTD